jgi:uncharacterized protein YndB with AHSA1/START domain
MLSTEHSTIINRPRKEVWDYATDPANQPVWLTNVIEQHASRAGQPEVGDRARNVGKVAGRRVTSTQEVTRVLPGEAIAFKSIEGPFTYGFAWSFEDADDGTRFTIRGETPGFGGFFGKLTDPLVLRLFDRDMRASLENLKTILEET